MQELLSPGFWSDIDIGLYEKAIESVLSGEKADKPDDKHLTTMINSLQVMRILLSIRTKDWIVSHVDVIQKLLEKALKMEDPEIQDCLHYAAPEDNLAPLVRQVLEAVPQERSEDEDAMELDTSQSDFVTKYSKTYVGEALSSGNLVSGISNLWTLSLVRPADVDEHFQGVMLSLIHI